MSDRRSPLDFYEPTDVAALPRSTWTPPKPQQPAPSLWHQFVTTAMDMAGKDEFRELDKTKAIDGGYAGIVAELKARGVSGNYSWSLPGGDPYYDPDKIWQGVHAARQSDPHAFAGLEDSPTKFEARLAAPHDAAIAQHAQEVQGYSWAPWLAGQAVGGFSEPENAVLMLTGAGEAKTIAQAALRDAGIDAQLAAVHDTTKVIGRGARGQDVAAGDVIRDVAGAAAIGAALGGGLKAAGPIAGAIAGKTRSFAGQLADRLRTEIGDDNLTPTERAAAAALDREDATLATSPFTPGAGSSEHLARMDAAEAALLNPAPIGGTGYAAPSPRGAGGRPVSRETPPPRFDANDYSLRVARVESGGKWQAQADTSSAFGLYQITQGTWERLAGKDGPAWSNRANPAAQENIFNRLTAANRAALAKGGVPETAGNLYLLHFAGEGGGMKVLHAAPDTPIAELLSARAIAANRSVLEGKTAGDVVAWAHGRMGDTPHAGPVLSREGFDSDDAWATAQRQVDAEDAALARAQDASVKAAERGDDVPFGDDDAPRSTDFGRDPFASLDDDAPVMPPRMAERGDDDIRAHWADRQAAGKRRDAVWAVRDADGRTVDWGFTEADAQDRIAARGGALTAERVTPTGLGERVSAARWTPSDTDIATYRAAVEALRADQGGEVRGALFHSEVGPIDLVYGDRRGGFAHIEDQHPDMIDDLPRRLAGMDVETASPNRVVLQGGGYRAIVRLDRDGVDQRWLLTAYERTDAPATAEYRRAIAEGQDDSPALGASDDIGDIAPKVEGFDHPDDVAATVQIDSLEHDLRMWLADDEAAGATVRLTEDGDVVNAADAMADLDADEAAVDAAEQAWRGGGPGRTPEEDGDELFLQTKAEATAAVNELREAARDRALDRVIAAGAPTTPGRGALTSLREALIRLDAGHLDADQFRARVQGVLSKVYEERYVKRYRDVGDRQRGPTWVREKLLTAVRRGDLDPDTADFADWFIRQNPALIDELGISVRAPRGPGEQGARGTYNPAARLVTLFRGEDVSTTAVHEILHHSERLMPAEMQQAIQREWGARVARLAARGDERQRAFAAAVLELQVAPTRATMDRALGLMPDGDAYQFINPSEFWAVNGADLLRRRYEAQGSMWGRIRTWMGEMVQHARAALRLGSDAPVLRALDGLIADGGGEAISPMLSRAVRYAQEAHGLARVIPGMVKRGEIDPARGKRMAEMFAELESFYKRSMGPDAAAAEASEATLKALRADARLKKRQTLLQINRQREALKEITRHQDADSYAAVAALLDDDDRAPYRDGNVETKKRLIEFDAHRRIADFIERHRRNLLGRPADASGLTDVIRELHGQATGNVRAKTFADAIGDTFEQLRQRFNAAGGNIGKLDGFGLPHRHDALKVRAVSRDQWLDDIIPELDRAKMIDERTSQPFTDQALRDTLGEVYETIRTNGLNGPPSAAIVGPGKLANQRAEHRFLHFADGDAWLRYDGKYGAGDTAFTTVLGHIGGMARDIAMMERLGPNPDATIRLLLDHVDRSKAQSDEKIVGAVAGTAKGRWMVENLWRYVKGASNVPMISEGLGGRIGFGAMRTMQGARNLLTARKLGSAAIPALTGDVSTAARARGYYGLSAISEVNSGFMARGFRHLPELKVLQTYLQQLNPLNASHRQAAVRLGLGMQEAAQSMASLARFYGEANGPGWTQVVADDVLRASGLNRITEAGQHAAGLEVLRTLGAARDLTWEALPDDLRAGMERSGIDKFDWTSMRQTPELVTAGVDHMDPNAIDDRRVADRLMTYVLRVRAASVQEATASARAATTFGTRAGTTGGEILRNSIQFKGFAIALLMKQSRMVAALPPRQAALYAARFFVGTTIAGAVMLQMREIAKGNDPLPMDDKGFWGKAALQGGGLGVVGDLMGTITDARVGSVAEWIAGPFASDIKDLKGIATTALPGREERADGTRKPANPGGAATRAVDHFTPGSNIWYLRAAWERMVIDQLHAELDPDAEKIIHRQQKALEKQGHGAWWAAGEILPGRAPDVSNALGAESPP